MDHLPYNIDVGDPVQVSIEYSISDGTSGYLNYGGFVKSIGLDRKVFRIIGVNASGYDVDRVFDIPTIQRSGDTLRVTRYGLPAMAG